MLCQRTVTASQTGQTSGAMLISRTGAPAAEPFHVVSTRHLQATRKPTVTSFEMPARALT